LEKALSECEPEPKSCEELAIENYNEGKEECSKLEDVAEFESCAERNKEIREAELGVCECQNAANAEFDYMMAMCQELGSESEI
jgi:hypothetical protein